MLARVADPRHRRGVRHRLTGILGLALCAVVAGARSFTAIAEWAADADGQTLRVLGVTGAVPSELTFRRTLQRLDADAFDDLAGAWAQQATMPGPGGRRVIAVDGKTLRGPACGGDPDDHLLAAPDHVHGAVLGQVEVGAKTNEIPMFPAPAGPHSCLLPSQLPAQSGREHPLVPMTRRSSRPGDMTRRRTIKTADQAPPINDRASAGPTTRS